MKGKRFWIIGASSGIGHALANAMVSSGITLILSSRNEEKLKDLNKTLPIPQQILPLDIKNPDQVIQAVSQVGALDGVVIMSAIYSPPQRVDRLDIAQVADIIQTNITGVIHVVSSVLPLLKPKGQLAVCASVAGYVGLPLGQPYSATKAALINFMESVKVENPDMHIQVINPGFVKTPMTDQNNFNMPMIITPAQAAQHIIKGLKQKHFEIHFPTTFTRYMKLLKLLPYRLYFLITKQLVKN